MTGEPGSVGTTPTPLTAVAPEALSASVAHGVLLRVRHWPAGPARPFLLVHGLSANARVWDEVAIHLARTGHPVYAVDLRGHGESSTPEDGYDLATAAADVAAVAAQMGLADAVVVGHSLGGTVALRLAVERPELVAGLALVDGGWFNTITSVGSRDDAAAIAAVLRRRATSRATMTGMREYLRATHPAWSPAAIEASLAGMRLEPDGLLAPKLPDEQFMAMVRSLWDDPPTRWYPRVEVPVLLLPAIPAANPEWARRVREWVGEARAALPLATVREYLDADHDIHAQHPERLAGDLLDLARTVDASAPA
nr:alpha/beta fold hydrolase [Micromonospora sp. DSM 115978]